ncbi:MAG: histidine phosphatase family protein [Neomegalonema sp.]|nr:histidine phosphatase family protein [Neomegalonema sp.]
MQKTSSSRLNRRQMLALCSAAAAFPISRARAEPRLWAALEQPGTAIILRHARAPGYSDPAAFTLGDCSTQRNLDARGREQARSIGEAFRANGIARAAVYTSEWCRCRETAELLDLGAVEPLPALNSFFEEREQSAARTAALLDFLRQTLPTPVPMVLVSHQVNISALTGESTGSGEGIVFRLDDQGRVELLESAWIRP